ncbi:MAG TPA: sulfatase-like hydrolase/transferase [Vicinamibacterales bacterium]|nr:sulfatase-like hydrolase/transferase [Vicinamibacterales bacterium]
MLLLHFVTALAATIAFKLALFIYAASGEGQTSAIQWYPRIVLVFGWDVVSALLVALVAWAIGSLLARVHVRVALAWALIVHALYGGFLLVSYHIAVIVGAPLDKAAIDLWFFYADPSPGGTSRLLADSVAPYFTPAFFLQLAIALVGPPLLFVWLRNRREPIALGRRSQLTLAVAVVLTLIAVPGLANGPLAVHTFGLERSPLTMLAGSYLKNPLHAVLHARTRSFNESFCFDLTSPEPVEGTDPLANATPRRTNVLFVIMESIGAKRLAMQPTPMPFLDAWSRSPSTVTFTNHYAHWPQTMKAAFSLWCSELPDPDYPPITEVNPAIPCVSISEAMKSAGYDTALFTSADFAFDRQSRFFKRRQLDVMLDRNEMPGHEGAWQNAWGIDERVTLKATFDWIAHHRESTPQRPFFVTYNMAAGHHPFEIPGSPSGRWLDEEKEAAAERTTLRFVDDRLRDVVEGLRAQHLLESTLIVVVSDHGPGSGRPGMGRVRDASIYEGSVHVPLVISGPQLADVTGPVTTPTGHIDVAPTILGLVDVPVPQTMKGRDLVHDTRGRLVMFATRPPLSQFGVRAGRWKLVHWDDSGANELFDLVDDPDERTDVSKAHPEIARTLEDRVERWKVQSANLIENYAAILGANGSRCTQ